MFSFLLNFLQNKGILAGFPLPLSACRSIRPYLLEKKEIFDGTVFMLAVPYLSKETLTDQRNLSAYAASRDYHLFFQELFTELFPLLQSKYPAHRFVGFADHSPFAEVEVASRAGLGVIGCNHLLITPLHSSYVFLGEIVTDAVLECSIGELKYCENCGSCMRACPAQNGLECLSALTQKKGALSPDEEAYLRRFESAWGCDICQEVCPHTKAAIRSGTIFTSVPFFQTKLIPELGNNILHEMTDADFAERAYSWRGKQTVQRNLQLLKEKQKGDDLC